MKVLVLGASGNTGRLVVQQARAAGHDVTAFIRATHGDATDAAAVQAAVAGHDAVVSTLGVGNALRSGSLIAKSFAVLVPAMERAGAHRLVVISALGVGSTRAQAPLFPRILYRLLLEEIFADKAAGERIVEASGLDWTIVHPPLLTAGPATAAYRTGEELDLTGMPKISRADVAHFIVGALASRQWNRKHAIVSP